MKCLHCENELPKARGWATDKKPRVGKKACMLPGCISHGLNFRTKLFRQIVMGLSEEEVLEATRKKAQKGVETQRAKGFYDDKSNNPYSKEYWIKRGLTEEEAFEKLSVKNKKGSETKMNKGFYEDKSNNPYSYEFWKKQGMTDEEARKKVTSRIRNCIDFWLRLGYNNDESKLLASQHADTNSLLAKIKKYGVEVGIEKYKQTCQQMSCNHNHVSSTVNLKRSSKQANAFFIKVYKHFRRLGLKPDDFYWELNRGELWLKGNDKIYFYDFVIKPLKIIIEYNGEHVHPKRDATSIALTEWKHAYSKKSAQEVLSYELEKEKIAQENGYIILHVWSQDENLEKLLLEIKNGTN